MSKPAFDRLGAALDKQDYQYLLNDPDSVEVLAVLEDEVRAGAEPEAIGRYIANRIGDHRVGTINRCIGAARWLQAKRTEQV